MPRLLKKYANRRIYDTEASRYVKLEDLEGLVLEGVDFRIVDAKTGRDLTRLCLLQALIELEEDRIDALPLPFLRMLLATRPGRLREFFDRHLSLAVETFMRSHRESRASFEEFQRLFTGGSPQGSDELARLREELEGLREEIREAKASPRKRRPARKKKGR